MRNIIKFSPIITIIIFFSCDLFIKRNPEDFIKNENKIGYLNTVSQSSTLTTTPIINIAVTNDKKYLYYTATDYNIYYCSINQNGSLEGFSYTGFQAFYSIASDLTTQFNIVISKDDKNIFTINRTNASHIDCYKRNKNGSISLISTNSEFSNPIDLINITPDGKHLIASSIGWNRFIIYEIKTNNTIKMIQSETFAGPSAYYIIPSKDGLYIYFFDSQGVLTVYKRNPLDGKIEKCVYISILPITNSASTFIPIISNNQKYIYCSDIGYNNFGRLIRKINDGKISYDNTLSYKYKNLISGYSFNVLAISNDDRLMYTADNSSNFFCLNLENNNIQNTYRLDSGYTINSITVSKNDNYIYCGDSGGRIIIFQRITE